MLYTKTACRDGSAFVGREAALLIHALAKKGHQAALKAITEEGQGESKGDDCYESIFRILQLL